MGNTIASLFTANKEKKAARAQAEAERRAALENVTVTSRGEDVQTSTTEANKDAEDVAQNKKSRRASLSKTVNTGSTGVMGGLVSGRQSLGGA